MFDVAPTELLVLGAVALLVIPPKDLPKAMRAAGYWVGKARGVARQFRSGFDEMIREAELHEMEKRWREENARIMREHSPEALMAPSPALAAPLPDDEPAAAQDGEAPPVMTEQPATAAPAEVAVEAPDLDKPAP